MTALSYDWTWSFKIFYMKKVILSSALDLTGTQCREANMGEIKSLFKGSCENAKGDHRLALKDFLGIRTT